MDFDDSNNRDFVEGMKNKNKMAVNGFMHVNANTN